MPRARKDQVSLDTTPYYHITSRCVRRSFLCGYDKVTQKDYSHRQNCIEQRIRLMASIFAIDSIRAIHGAPPPDRHTGVQKLLLHFCAVTLMSNRQN